MFPLVYYAGMKNNMLFFILIFVLMLVYFLTGSNRGVP